MMKMLGFASEKVFDYRYKVETVRSNRKLQSAAAAVLHYNQRWAVIFEIDMLWFSEVGACVTHLGFLNMQ